VFIELLTVMFLFGSLQMLARLYKVPTEVLYEEERHRILSDLIIRWAPLDRARGRLLSTGLGCDSSREQMPQRSTPRPYHQLSPLRYGRCRPGETVEQESQMSGNQGADTAHNRERRSDCVGQLGC
jgi:hypothetical protein